MCLRFIDPDGVPYPGDLMEQSMLMAHDAEDMSKKIVRQDTLDDGSLLSTVWLGLCHNNNYDELFDLFGPMAERIAHVHIIYETALFPHPGMVDIIERYATRAEALEGHMDALSRYHAHQRG